MYKTLGIPQGNIHRFDYPDFSLGPYGFRILPRNNRGIFDPILKLLRDLQISRLIITNGYREHSDHSATSQIGVDTGPQVGDPILPDVGKPYRIKSYLVYSVWGDFSP